MIKLQSVRLFPTALLVLTGVIVAGCSVPQDSEKPSKADIPRCGAGDQAADPCEENGWYGDGECDDGLEICHKPDVLDCGAPQASGCTDNMAYNYSASATADDGSCIPWSRVHEGNIFAGRQEALAALEGKWAVAGSVTVQNYVTLEPMRELRIIEGKLDINYTVTLERLDGLERLSRIGGSLVLSGNQHLVDLDALYGSAVDGDLAIEGNAFLQAAEAASLHEALVANGFSGSATISDNGGQR